MNDEIKSKLARYSPIFVAVRLHEGKVQGRVEHSFAMGWDDKLVRVWWSGKAYSILGEHQLSGEQDAKYNINQFQYGEMVFDALSEDCPIEVDWEKWLAALEKQPGDKHAKRNAPFKIKTHGLYQLRALTAERELNYIKPVLESVCKQRDEAEEKLQQLDQIINPREEEEHED